MKKKTNRSAIIMGVPQIEDTIDIFLIQIIGLTQR